MSLLVCIKLNSIHICPSASSHCHSYRLKSPALIDNVWLNAHTDSASLCGGHQVSVELVSMCSHTHTHTHTSNQQYNAHTHTIVHKTCTHTWVVFLHQSMSVTGFGLADRNLHHFQGTLSTFRGNFCSRCLTLCCFTLGLDFYLTFWIEQITWCLPNHVGVFKKTVYLCDPGAQKQC